MSSRIKTIELFLSLSLVTAVGTQTLPSDAYETEETTTETYSLMAQGGEGGEGGEGAEGGEGGEGAEGGEGGEGGEGAEGGEGGEGAEGGEGGEGAAESVDSDEDYMTVLGLMKGHLLAAEELIAAGNYEQVAPHISHPAEKLYSSIEPMLAEKGVEEFKPTLNQLYDLAQSAPDSSEMQDLLDQSQTSIDSAIAAIPEEQLNSPEFVLNSMVEMLKNAAAEYEAAIANEQFAEVVQYQDSRGFVLYADELYQTVAEQKSQEDPEGHQVITESLAELKTAWPSIEPPETPIKEPSEVYGLVSQIEFNI